MIVIGGIVGGIVTALAMAMIPKVVERLFDAFDRRDRKGKN